MDFGAGWNREEMRDTAQIFQNRDHWSGISWCARRPGGEEANDWLPSGSRRTVERALEKWGGRDQPVHWRMMPGQARRLGRAGVVRAGGSGRMVDADEPEGREAIARLAAERPVG